MRGHMGEEKAMKTRVLGLAVAAILIAAAGGAVDLPAPNDDDATLRALPAAKAGDVHSARKDWAAARDADLTAIEESATLHNKLGI